MCIRLATHSTRFPEPQVAQVASVFTGGERDRAEELSGRQTLAVLMLLGVVFLLMLAPALVAAASLMDRDLLNRFQDWLSWLGVPTHYLDLARFGSTLVLSGLVSNAREGE